MDRQKLRSLVFEKTGIKVDSDDPIFALVALNEAVLADTVERQVALLAAAAQELAQQAREAGGAAPAAPAAWAPAPAAPAGPSTPSAQSAPAGGAPLFEAREWRLLGGAGVVALLSAALALAGQALLSRPAAAPPVSSEGAAQAEKLARAVQKLDPAGQALIRSEMQKP